jgi:hypothetical protein
MFFHIFHNQPPGEKRKYKSKETPAAELLKQQAGCW